MTRSLPRFPAGRALAGGLAATLAMTRKELYSYLVSPMVYVVTAVFLLINGLIFYATLANGFPEPNLRPILPTTAFLLLLVIPVLTMRLLAEEKSTGTMELLMTFPITDTQVVAGKFLATLAVYGLMLVTTLGNVVILKAFGSTEWGPLLTAYLGLLLFGAAVIAIGMLSSSLTRSQIVAAVIGIGLLLLLWIMGGIGGLINPRIGAFFTYLSVNDHLNQFMQGVIDLKDIVYYLSMTLGALFLTVQIFQSARWRA
ncbi:MAG TPA: ABC transporter permease [Chloroflexota bacterium]|nr:ABC transporter permease [Chloroflexota bacterium]